MIVRYYIDWQDQQLEEVGGDIDIDINSSNTIGSRKHNSIVSHITSAHPATCPTCNVMKETEEGQKHYEDLRYVFHGWIVGLLVQQIVEILLSWKD